MGSIIEKCRDSLAKLTTEPVSSNPGSWIQIRRIGLGRESASGAPPGIRSQRRVPWRRHHRRTRKLNSEHDSEKEKHGEEEQSTTSSPHARTEPRTDKERRRARDGGRWWRGRAPSSLWHLRSSVNTAKGLDGGGKVCGLGLYIPKAVPRKEGEDLDSDSVGGNEGK
jgi:hypothetical protein